MSEAPRKSAITRRSFVSRSAVASAVMLALPLASESLAEANRFRGLVPLKPAPPINQTNIPAPPLVVLVLNKAG